LTDREGVDVIERTTNRHGVPRFHVVICRWPGCKASVPFIMAKTHLCVAHALEVWREVNAAQLATTGDLMPAVIPAAPEPEPRRPVPVTDGTIYYVKVGGSHIKIGWTSDLTRRMTEYPPNTELLAAHPGTRAEERKMHKRFAVHRSHGREWYPLVPVILDHIKRVVAEHGVPDVTRFGAKPTEVPTPRAKQCTKVRGRSGPSAFIIH
jgi:hypothetical protein